MRVERSCGGRADGNERAEWRRADQVANRRRKGRLGGRPPIFDREADNRRNTVERCINPLKNCRGQATRYDLFRAGLHIAGIFVWSAR
ncbi:hypothetical protein [Streptomyces gilvifuscus]|uniref:hypothetical protein n=1 Tax=Streptomyces gilvifuscus TaxID=1550617 RepID=UPI003A924607